MRQKIYQIGAFKDKAFSGISAAVCLLDKWLKDEIMQKIAMENGLSEVAFCVKQGNEYEIRWFTPTSEVNLCVRATLAAANVLFNHENHNINIIYFHSPRNGMLTVTKKEKLLTLNFLEDILEQVELSEKISEYFFVFDNETEIKNTTPVYYLN